MHIGIGGYCRTHIDADRRRIDQLCMSDPVCLYSFDMLRQLRSLYMSFQSRQQAFQNQRRFSRTGYTGDHRQPPFGNIHLQRLNRMDTVRRQMDTSLREYFSRITSASHMRIRCLCQKRPDHGCRIFLNILYCAFCDHMPATGSGFRAHLNDPVRFRKDLRIVIYQQYRIAVSDQIVHHTVKSGDIGRMQTD